MDIFTQIVILMIVLSSMVMVLLAIRQLTKFEGFDDSNETKELKEELEEDKHVVSNNNIFHTLVEAPDEKSFKKKKFKPEEERRL